MSEENVYKISYGGNVFCSETATGRLRFLERADGPGVWHVSILQQEIAIVEHGPGEEKRMRYKWRDVPLVKGDA